VYTVSTLPERKGFIQDVNQPKGIMMAEKEIRMGVNMPDEMAAELEKRAGKTHLSTAAYCRFILQQWLDSGEKLMLCEEE